MSLTPSQIQAIKSTVPVLAEHGYTITKTMYSNMITQNPSLKSIFSKASQDTGKQPAALANTLYAYAANIDNLPALRSTIERISQKHSSLYIEPCQYTLVATHLIAAFKTVLGPALTPEILDAWTAAYTQIAQIMIDREKSLYSQNEEWLAWREFRIERKEEESACITSFYLHPVDKKPLPAFTPGSYISIQLTIPELGHAQCRQFSLSDAPNAEYYRISVKKRQEEDDELERHYITNLLHDSKDVGDVIEVSYPRGDFLLRDPHATTPLILISAGVGFTPLLSMLNATLASESRCSSQPRPISWIQAARDGKSQAFGCYIRRICAENANVRARVFLGNVEELAWEEGMDMGDCVVSSGRIDLERLGREKILWLGDAAAEYYVCGPKGFMRDVKMWLLGRGVGRERISFEIFGPGELE